MSAKGAPRAGGIRTPTVVLTAVCATVWGLTACGGPPETKNGAGPGSTPSPTTSAEVELPPPHAGFDYQIGGAYPPPAGVRIVSRDRTAAPAPGLYNICYVNAFQAQPGEEKSWPADLLLRDANGETVVDDDWDEALLDIGTAAKRKRIAARVDTWIDGCADKGFDAVEPDNYDSYTRSDGLLTAADATAFITLLSKHAHARGLAIGQKNTVELAGLRKRTGLDFAVAEECGEYDECGEYAEAFDDRVVVIEYTDSGLRKARAAFGDRLSIVRRDVDVSTPGSAGYIRRTR
ncbi:endo alpha-1,4 polygalactosaminidase [Streptomyces sp. NBC_00459]|uniref:endo alpha-1,4 polygalactosaminidase n=1 Tax=Streptomyces sp. NBC_00459 TaxID=2975749 RepID=UPI002E1740A2